MPTLASPPPEKRSAVTRSHSQALAPYTGPWTRAHARHLVRRLGFGAIKREVDGALNDGSAATAVARLLDAATSDPNPDPPTWYNRNRDTGITEVYELQRSWYESMRLKGLIEKMTLFWHNHLVTQYDANAGKTSASIGHMTYDYYITLRTHAFGNVRELIYDIGLTPAMLVYLDGHVNARGGANENYARELLELFTMGQDGPDGSPNYTEGDIKEIARALTGWVVTSDNRSSFDLGRHDRSMKTVFGQTGDFGYDEIVDLVFEQRADAIAYYLCRKLYTYFVQPVPDEAVVQAMAAILVRDFEIRPVLESLFTSAHFYDQTRWGAQIKSPLAFIIGFLREAEVTPTHDLLEAIRVVLTPSNLGQELLNPPNVAGWPGLNPPDSSGTPGHFNWLNTTTLPERWQTLISLLFDTLGEAYDPLALAQKISDPSDPFAIARDIAETLIPLPLDVVGIREVSAEFGGDPNLPPPDSVLNGPKHLVNLSKLLLDGSPHYEWPLVLDLEASYLDDARTLLRSYIAYLIQLPAYQLT